MEGQLKHKRRFHPHNNEQYSSNGSTGADQKRLCEGINDKTTTADEPSNSTASDCTFIFFDIETSGRSNKTADILQIAAKVKKHTFSVYIKPTQPISEDVSAVNGLKNINGSLYFKGKKCNTVSMRDALHQFLLFLSGFPNGCILIAHNAIFDVSFILREIVEYSLETEFRKIVYGVCDSLKLFKKKFPERKGPGMMTLSKLAEDLLEDDVSIVRLHEGLYDVEVLEKLIEKQLDEDDILRNVTKFDEEISKFHVNREIDLKKKPFYIMMLYNINDRMITKIAKSGVTFEELMKIYEDSGKEALKLFLSEKINNKPRITNKKDILSKIVQVFEDKHLDVSPIKNLFENC